MKVVWLHPPLYPVNVELFDLLGQQCELVVFVFGDAPADHPDWQLSTLFRPKEHRFRVRLMAHGTYPRGHIGLPLFLPALMRERAQVVLTIAFAPYGFYAAWLKKFGGYRMVLVTDATARSDDWVQGLRRRSRSWLLGHCDLAVGCSPQTVDYLRQLQPQVPTALCWHTVHVTQWRAWQSALVPRRQLRQAWGLPVRPQLILGVGRLVDHKNWRVGFLLLQREAKLHYLVVGNGPESTALLQEARAQGLADRFHLRPKCSPQKLAEAYTLADALFMPSERDPFGFVVSEAMACGLPVFCSRHCGAASWVEESGAGLTFDPGNDFPPLFDRFWRQRKTFALRAKRAMDQFGLEMRAEQLFSHLQKNATIGPSVR